MNCQICGGETFDNVAENAQRKARGEKLRPNYKCRDKNCTWVQWPPKDGARPAPKAPAANAKGAYSGGPHIPGLDDEPDPEGDDARADERLAKMKTLYTDCYIHASDLAHGQFGKDVSDAAVGSMTATLFIQACDAGLHR